MHLLSCFQRPLRFSSGPAREPTAARENSARVLNETIMLDRCAVQVLEYNVGSNMYALVVVSRFFIKRPAQVERKGRKRLEEIERSGAT